MRMRTPIECKRLPTPEGKDRDEREYVFSRHSTTGGIQRFKNGHHGAAHRLAAMIAFIQQGNAKLWQERIAKWIIGLAGSREEGWSAADDLSESSPSSGKVKQLHSFHTRANGLLQIALRHLWIEIN